MSVIKCTGLSLPLKLAMPGLIICATLTHFSAEAAQGPCTPTGGTHVFNFNNAQNRISDPDKNAPGVVLKDVFNFDLGSTYSMTGCEYRGPAYVTSTSSLPVIGKTADGGNWYALNEYLGVSMEGYIEGRVHRYFPVPFISRSNGYIPTTDRHAWRSGSKGKISVLIRRKFVGFSAFSKTIMQTQISTDPGTGAAGPYASQVVMSGQIDVPQMCELNAGNTITIDFGNIGASRFSEAGPGKKPAGVKTETREIGLRCQNIDAQALLTLRLEASDVSGNMMVSDNRDVGFIVGDARRNPLTPNTPGSRIPFRLDDDARASVAITAWPVSVTGKKPTEGRFTAEGYLRVDFD